jgi:excisionase family DNA binding protein
MMSNLLTIKKAAEQLSVSDETLRNWEKDNKIEPVYTVGGHRRYKQEDIDKVSTTDQKSHGDLERQVGRLSAEAVNRGYTVVSVLNEVASGMNDKRIKLARLMTMAINKEVDIVLIEHKDRLTRFLYEFLVVFFRSHNVEIVYTTEILGTSFEQELVEDILSLMASFSAKIYSKRAKENRKKKKGLEEVSK